MRLIDADALEELFRCVIGGIAKEPEMTGNLEHMIRASAMVIEMIHDSPTMFIEMIHDDPTIGQPQVVKCKDCKHGRQFETNAVACEYRELATEPEWFCADGERKQT